MNCDMSKSGTNLNRSNLKTKTFFYPLKYFYLHVGISLILRNSGKDDKNYKSREYIFLESS